MNRLVERLKNISIIRKMVYATVGFFSYPGLALVNRIEISGTEHIERLPRQNVLFVSNHQTYFADVITFLHIFCAVKWRKQNKLGIPYYLINPFSNVYFIAAEETMKDSWMTRIFALAVASRRERDSTGC
jgi:1-acyl-sn-glycerol-3-phosphate acyltransferase